MSSNPLSANTNNVECPFAVGDRVVFEHPFNGRWYGTVQSVERAGIRRLGIVFDYYHVHVTFEDAEDDGGESFTSNNERLRAATPVERLTRYSAATEVAE